MAEAYIVAATRTAGGRKGGRLREWHPADLGAVVLNAALAALLLGNAKAEPGAAAGSFIVLGSMLWFAWLVFRNVDARG